MNASEVAGKRVAYCPAYYVFPMSRFSKKNFNVHVCKVCAHRRPSLFRDASFSVYIGDNGRETKREWMRSTIDIGSLD